MNTMNTHVGEPELGVTQRSHGSAQALRQSDCQRMQNEQCSRTAVRQFSEVADTSRLRFTRVTSHVSVNIAMEVESDTSNRVVHITMVTAAGKQKRIGG